MKHKEFKPFDKVLVSDSNGIWQIDFYSHWSDECEQHVTLAYGDGLKIDDNDILLFEGNEHLVGTTDEPDEEIDLKEGDWVMREDSKIFTSISTNFRPVKFIKVSDNLFEVEEELNNGLKLSRWCNLCIRFSDFDPTDMEKTKKHILCAKDGKIVRYKG